MAHFVRQHYFLCYFAVFSNMYRTMRHHSRNFAALTKNVGNEKP